MVMGLVIVVLGVVALGASTVLGVLVLIIGIGVLIVSLRTTGGGRR